MKRLPKFIIKWLETLSEVQLERVITLAIDDPIVFAALVRDEAKLELKVRTETERIIIASRKGTR